jgi:rare lipoprotein A (peptidoglycan hydrolase)
MTGNGVETRPSSVVNKPPSSVSPHIRTTCLIFTLLTVCAPAWAATGTASWYDSRSCQREARDLGLTGDYWGKVSASGVIFDEDALTAASWDYPFGSQVKVRNLRHPERFVIVTITDRGPSKKLYRKGRIIDLSRGAFKVLDILREGVIPVEVTRATR